MARVKAKCEDEGWLDDDQGREEVTAYEVVNARNAPLKKWREAVRREDEAAQKAETEARERAELAALQKKYAK